MVSKQWNCYRFFTKILPFFVSVTLSGLVRISKTKDHWKDQSLICWRLSRASHMSPWLGYWGQPQSHAMTLNKLIDWLKLMLLTNWYPASRGSSILLVKSGSLMDSKKSSFETRKPSLEFRETSIFLYSPIERISWNDLFLEKHKNNLCMFSERTDQQHLSLPF